MSGLRLYAVNPRSLGTLPEWTVAVLEAERLGCNALLLHPFHPVSAVPVNVNGRDVTGSLYAITDYLAINPEFCTDMDAATARTALRDFVRLARSKNMRVVADLVFNYIAADHPLVSAHPEFFRRDKGGELFVAGTLHHPWHDVAVIDYTHPGAWDYFLGQSDTHKGYWLRVMDDYLDLGFDALRCDAVYAAPQLMWEQVLNYALAKAPDTLVIAETMGITGDDADAMRESLRDQDARIIYDLVYDDRTRGWDGKSVLYVMQLHSARPEKISHHGYLGMVDDIAFMPRAAELRNQLLAKGIASDVIVGAACLRDYAVALFTHNSVILPRGYQWCIADNTGSFREMVSAEFFRALKFARHRAPSPLTLGPQIAELHHLRARLPANAQVRISPGFETGYKFLTAMQCDFLTGDDGRVITSFILLLNTAPEFGPQPFPQDYWQTLKEQQTHAERLQFGKDRNHPDDISGIAIITIPGGMHTSMVFNQGRKAAPDPHAPEPSLVA